MRLTQNTNGNYTLRQLKLTLNIENLIDISDPVYTFCEVMEQIFIDVNSYIFEKDHVNLEHTYIDGTKSNQFMELFYERIEVSNRK